LLLNIFGKGLAHAAQQKRSQQAESRVKQGDLARKMHIRNITSFIGARNGPFINTAQSRPTPATAQDTFSLLF